MQPRVPVLRAPASTAVVVPPPAALERLTASAASLPAEPHWWDYSNWGQFTAGCSRFHWAGGFSYSRGNEVAAYIYAVRYCDRYGAVH